MRRYVTVDVFTDTPFSGNPLAVVLDANGLDSNQMQAIATEFNYSETTFILPPTDDSHTANVRIFTPSVEIPFAGHPNVGTAIVIARQWLAAGKSLPESFIFEEKAGLVPLRLEVVDGRVHSAELTAPEPLSLGAETSIEDAALCLGIDKSEIVTDTHAPVVASVGLPFLVVQLKSREILSRTWGEYSVHQKLLVPIHAKGVYCYYRDGLNLHARMFCPLDKVAEDPATGSATVATVALIATVEKVEGERKWLAVQGEDMGRKSVLHGRSIVREGRLMSVHVGGTAVEVMKGIIT